MPMNRPFALARILLSGAALASAIVLSSAGLAHAADGCSVLRRSAVERAVGAKVKPGDAPTGVGGECSFTVKGHPADVVNVWVLEGDEAESGFRNGEEIGGDDAVPVPKLGEDAFYIGDPFNTAYVLEDGTLVYLQYYVFSGDATPKEIKRAVVSLTGQALTRARS